MDNNSNNKQNRSMYIYTALIFVVALLLIIIAFFGQRNITNNQQNVNNIAESTEVVTETVTDVPAADTPTAEPEPNDYAKLSNAFETLSAENESLKNSIKVYELLLSANKAASENDFEAVKTILAQINPDTLNDEQKILYNQITNEREE